MRPKRLAGNKIYVRTNSWAFSVSSSCRLAVITLGMSSVPIINFQYHPSPGHHLNPKGHLDQSFHLEGYDSVHQTILANQLIDIDQNKKAETHCHPRKWPYDRLGRYVYSFPFLSNFVTLLLDMKLRFIQSGIAPTLGQ